MDKVQLIPTDAEIPALIDAIIAQRGGVKPKPHAEPGPSITGVQVKQEKKPRIKLDPGLSRAAGRKSRDWKSWLGELVRVYEYHNRKHGFQSDLDIKYLAKLLASQGTKCAITGMKLTHISGDMAACTVTRIDTSKGYVQGNIKFVCLWVSRVCVNGTTADDILKLMAEIKEKL